MGNFWAEKLRITAPEPAPRAVTDVQAWWATEHVPFFPSPESPTQTVGATHRRTGSASCPECGSSNYMQPNRNAAWRCFDCNYPTMHSTSGAHIGSGTPFGKPVRQVTGTGWHPETIIGRIG